VRVRTYRPAGVAAPLPGYLLVPSGGFWNGGIAQAEALARLYARKARCLVATVEYRLAPEHPWPAAPDDVEAALRWFADNASGLGVDADRIGIGGVSAGACIAAAVAIRVRDRGGPRLAVQLLEIPVTDLTMGSASMTSLATGYVVTRDELAEGYGYYVADPALRKHPDVSPLFADDLTGLPPTLVVTCQFDPLRDDGERYAERLRAAQIPVRVMRARGHIHGSLYSGAWWLPSARRHRARSAAALRSTLHGM
ncbi:MAG: acetyl esterase, partial [Pseudonocardiales bacterium]|nr:acetyl esterase [Pseudonocardiales bacterium]